MARLRALEMSGSGLAVFERGFVLADDELQAVGLGVFGDFGVELAKEGEIDGGFFLCRLCRWWRRIAAGRFCIFTAWSCSLGGRACRAEPVRI